jgi:hypothetical protein
MTRYKMADDHDSPAAQAVRNLLAGLQLDAHANGAWDPDSAIDAFQEFLDYHGFTLRPPRRPMVTTDEYGNFVCPACQAVGEIAEEDKALRWNTISVGENHKIVACQGKHEFEHRRYLCTVCRTAVALPHGTTIDHWVP